jgi:hypothetical protein
MSPTLSRSLCFVFAVFSLCLLATDALSVKTKRALTPPTDLAAGWSYLGCYTDSVGARTLGGANYNGNDVTDEACVSFCAGKGYSFAGTEYAGQCFCGTSLASSGVSAPETDCNVSIACLADSTWPFPSGNFNIN